MTKLLSLILKMYAKAYIWRFKPTIIAITGNVGKTSTKEAIAAVLRHQGLSFRAGSGNLNNEIGVPLNILGDMGQEYYEKGSSLGFWLRVIYNAKAVFWFGRKTYPKYLVLEFGADHPGDIKKLASAYHPHIAIVTAVGDIPVHVEYFTDPDHLANEKSNLVRVLNPGDHAVLNFDDPAVLAMKEKTKGHVHTFGFGEGAKFRVSDLNLLLDEAKAVHGITFKLHDGMNVVPVRIHDSLGRSQAMAALAAAAVADILGINLVAVSEAMAEYEAPNGRLKLLKGIKDTTIIDDTYNASPAAMHVALDTLSSIPAKRKIAVLGNMLELGKYTPEAHRAVGNRAAEVADILVCVGDHAMYIADSAADQMLQENIYKFHDSNEAKLKVQELLQPGDLILVKGSQGVRMERIVKEIMAEPERAHELLVRQNKKWLSK